MRRATPYDRKRAVSILANAFKENPGVLWVVKNDSKMDDRIVALCEYCYDTAFEINGVFISNDFNGVSLIFPMENKKFSWRTPILYFKLAVNALGIFRIGEVIRRELYLSKHRPKHNFLYFWMVAVDPNCKGIDTMQEMTYWAAAYSKHLNLPLVAETTLEKNKKVYERYGYEEYHRWNVSDKDVCVHFMIRQPK